MVRVTRRKLHIDFLREFTIKKSIFDIHMKEWSFASRINGNKSLSRRKSSHRSKSLLIINPITTQGGSRYFVIFVDDFSKYTWIYLFKNRSELSQIYCDFTKMIETHFSKPIKVFNTTRSNIYRVTSKSQNSLAISMLPNSSTMDEIEVLQNQVMI